MNLNGAEITLTLDSQRRRLTIFGRDVAFAEHNLLVLDGRFETNPAEWPMTKHLVRLPIARATPRLLAAELRVLDPVRELISGESA